MIRHPGASLAAWFFLLALPCPAQGAGISGDSIEATCSAATKGTIENSTVTIVCGVPHEQVAEFMRLAVSGRPGDYTELLGRLDALIPTSSRLRAEALARFFAILDEAAAPPEQLTDKLVEIAQHYEELLAQLENANSPDPEVQQLKQQAHQALEAGDFDQTEKLLNQAKARDLSAIERMQANLEARKLSAAQAAAENGALMMTQLRYAKAAGYYAEAVGLTPEKSAELFSQHLTSWAEAAWRAGDYPAAVEAARRGLSFDEARLTPDDARIAADLNNLAVLYQATGRYPDAAPLFQRAIAIGEKTLGPEHPDVAPSLNNLAELYRYTGRYAEAEPLFQRAIAIGEKTLGPEHPDVAPSLNNLAELYRYTGRYAEAEPLYRRAIAIGEKTFGPEHPDLATQLNNLAELYRATGRYAEAEPLFQRAITIGEQTLGSEHPTLATRLNNLALLYRDTGRYAEAEPLYQRGLAILDETLPPDHPYRAMGRENYADLLDRLGRGAEASRLRAQAAAIRQRRAALPASP